MAGVAVPFVRGDATADGQVDITDAIFSLGCLFLGSECPGCPEAADANGDGAFDISDAIRTLAWLFQGGPALPAPSPSRPNYDPADCGTSPAASQLGCARFPPCIDAGGRDTTPPDLTLETPLDTVVAASPLSIRGRAMDDRGLPGVAVGSTVVEVAANGAFEAGIDLLEGPNLIPVVAADGSGNRSSAIVSAILDSTPPDLTLDEPAAGIVNSRTVRVSGSAADLLTDVSVTVDGLPAALAGCAFSAEVTLPDGPASIVVIATDGAGNQTAVRRDVTVFVSPASTLTTPGGATLLLPEGALTRPDETVELRDLTTDDIRESLGPDGDEVVAQVPPGGLTEDMIVIPGAVAMTFDAADLPDLVVNGTPGPVVAVMGALTNDIPLWILQLVPDSDGDGLPELRLASQARITADGLTMEPVPPPPGSPLPGFCFAPEHGFDETTIGQVPSLEHASRTFVACCCSSAAVPVIGNTKCNTGPTAKNLCEEADRIRAGMEALQRQLQRTEAQRRDVLLNEILGADGSLVPVLALIAAVALAGAAIEAAAAEVSGASLAELAQIADDVLGPTPPGTSVGLANLLVGAILETVQETIEAFNRDLDRYMALTQDIADLQALIERDAITYEGLKAAAHTFSGCSDALVLAS
ncbi:MAG TPA: hypothetical protein VMN39_01815, partial [Longimicrobiaceae bacterium]|nr:hypothetical protein [Longimicrobiaceae bacterium]